MFLFQVSVCAGGQTFYHYGSFVVGVFGGLSYISWAIVLVHSGIDDPMDTIAGKKNGQILIFLVIGRLGTQEFTMF